MFLAPLLLLLELALLHGGVGDQLEISLNGDWSLSDTDGRVKAIKAQVPGSVHLDLMYADGPIFVVFFFEFFNCLGYQFLVLFQA